MGILDRIFRRQSANVPVPPVQVAALPVAIAPPESVPSDPPIYPPFDAGIPAHPLSKLLVTQVELLRRIKLAAGLTEEDFHRLYTPIINNFAAYVHLLPATRAGNHRGAGGMFRLGLEMGFYSLQACSGAIFAMDAPTETRNMSETRWRFATFIAGLCSETYKVLNELVVVDEAGERWPAFIDSLSDWLDAQDRKRYYVTWLGGKGDTQASTSTLVVNRIVPAHALEYMRQGGHRIVPTMFSVISGAELTDENATMHNIVETIRQRVVEADASVQPDNYGRMTLGTHLEPHLLDAMRQLLNTNRWEINVKKSRVWCGNDGLFIVWPQGWDDMRNILRNLPGIPFDSDTVTELMAKAEIIEVNAGGRFTWEIEPPGARASLNCVKISNPALLFGKDDPPRLDQHLSKPAAGRRAEGHKRSKTAEESPGVNTTMDQAAGAAQGGQEQTQAPAAVQSEIPFGESTPVDLPPNELREKLLSEVDANTAEVLRTLLEDHAKGRIPNTAFVHENGFAIAKEQLESYGLDVQEIVKDLHAAGWLMGPADQPRKKFISVVKNDKAMTCIHLEELVATGLGFIQKKS